MSKTTTQSQGAFSFLEEVEKTEPLPKPKKHTLKPPVQIEVEESKEAEQAEQEPEAQNAAEAITIPVAEPVTAEEESVEKESFPVAQNDQEPDGNEDSISPDPEEEAEQNDTKSRRNTRGRKSAKEHSIAASMVELPDDETLFSKQYYSMGEVTTMFKENHSLIRYWESEFDILKPKKNGKGDRFFRPVDVKNLYLIYDLLRRRKFTIEGAREYLKNNKKAEEKFAAVQSLEKIKAFFLELKATL